MAIAYESLLTTPQIISVDSMHFHSSSTDTAYYATTPLLFFDTQYWWSVRGINAWDTTAWMPSRKFATQQKVSLSAPADAATNISTIPQLKWTAMTGTDYYIIQYDTSALFTSPVQVIRYADTVTYNITDELLGFTTYHWRVASVSAIDTTVWNERSFTTGSGIGIEESALSPQNISIYPNPCRGKLSIEMNSSSTGEIRLTLSDILGQQLINHEVQLKNGKNVHHLNLEGFSKGIYMLKLQDGSNTLTRKVILDY